MTARPLLVGILALLLLGDAGRAAEEAAPARPRRELRKVALDPGHGGDERGAVGPGGLEEKVVTLEVCRLLRSHLEASGLSVMTTRDEDRAVDLWDRATLANRAGAELFVSVHANSSPARIATGAETYFLSLDAPDEDARRLAAIENQVVSAASAPPEVRDDVSSILWSVAQESFLAESQQLAVEIQGELDSALQVPDRGIKQAPFVVLRNVTMPAVLVEIGFISNPAIEKKLRDPAYQERIAVAIAAGIERFRKLAVR